MAITGVWNLSMKTPMGVQKPVLTLVEANREISGTMRLPGLPPSTLTECKLVGKTATMKGRLSKPTVMYLVFSVEFEGDSLVGTCTSGTLQPFAVSGAREIPLVDRRPRLTRWKEFLFG